MSEILQAFVLGIVEGATEFIPVSSTGHLILAGSWLGFEGDFADSFNIVIQLGAILAVVWLYRSRLWSTMRGLGREPRANRLTLNLLAAFLPAAVVGAPIHDWITSTLFSPVVVAAALVAGGVAILLIERAHPHAVTGSVDELKAGTALGIGIAQVASLVPGVSRSGATIMGALALGLSRTAAAEFSFFLAIPVMFAATLFELVTSQQVMTADRLPVLATGFVTAFGSAVLIVRAFLRFIAAHRFTAFAWYRIVFGLALLAWYLG